MLSWLFGSRADRTRAEPLEVHAALREARKRGDRDPDGALNRLRRSTRRLYPLVGISGRMHREFRDLVEDLWRRSGAVDQGPLPSLQFAAWNNWQDPTLGDIHAAAGRTDCDLLYLVDTDEYPKDALSELEAMRMLQLRDELAMVVLGDTDFMIRRDFLLDAGATLPAEAMDIGQDLADHAKARGLRCAFITL
jgi:hypothetical protein